MKVFISVAANNTVSKPARETFENKNFSECKGFNPINPYIKLIKHTIIITFPRCTNPCAILTTNN